MQIELWKSVPEFELNYEVSNFGNVRTKKRISVITRGVYKDKEVGLKHICLSRSKRTGYIQVNFYKNYYKKTHLLHRLVATVFLENPLNLPQVNHKDGNKANNNVTNLEWCTAKENVQHAVVNGLRADVSGIKNPRAKLSPEVVMAVYNSTLSRSEISEKYNVNKVAICEIKNGRKWSTLTKHFEQIIK